MADITYPSSLPDFRLSKARTEQQGYRTTQPFAGPLFIEAVTDESPVTWQVKVTCRNQLESRSFKAFVRSVKNGEAFNKDILTEEGHITHEVRFIDLPLTPRQIDTEKFEYTGVIYATALISNDENIDNDQLIYDWLVDSNIIDNAVNNLWTN